MLNVYYSIVYPHLIYGIQVWGSSFDTNLNELEILPTKVVRLIIHNDNFYNSSELAHSQHLFYKLKLSRTSINFKFPNIHGYDTRRKRKFSPYVRTTYYGLKSIKVEGVKIWNNIPDNVNKIENKKVFRRNLKKSLLFAYLNI